MFKVVFSLKRTAGMSLADFRDFWLEDHAPKVARLPGLRKYHVDICTDDGDESRPADGFAVLWFDDADGFRTAFGSDYARDEVLPNNEKFNDATRRTAYLVEEHVFL